MEIYQVGGSVRDELLGLKSKDIDHAVVCDSYEQMRDHLLAEGYTIFLEKPEFVTLRAKKPHSKLVSDYTMCRIDGFYSDGRRPDDVKPGTLHDDLARRDFTVNAIAKDGDEYIDPFNGLDDLDDMLLRCVGDPMHRLREDALRILRAFRFCITKGFTFHKSLIEALHNEELYPLLAKVSVERRREELMKMMKHDTIRTIEMIMSYPEGLRKAIFSDGLWLMPTMKHVK